MQAQLHRLSYHGDRKGETASVTLLTNCLEQGNKVKGVRWRKQQTEEGSHRILPTHLVRYGGDFLHPSEGGKKKKKSTTGKEEGGGRPGIAKSAQGKVRGSK